MLFEDLSDEWKEWLELTPIERFRQSEKIFADYLAMGASLDPDPDPTSPFYDPETSSTGAAYGRAACVFYGAAQFSKDIDVVLLASDENFSRLMAALC